MKLRVKLPLVYTLLIAALGTAFVVFTSRLLQEHRVEEEQEYFQSLAEALAMSTATAIGLGDRAALRDFVERVARGEHVSYAAVLDESGRVLAHTRHELEGKIPGDPVSRAAAAAGDVLIQHDGADILDVAVPLAIAGKKSGAVRVGYSLVDVKQKLARAQHLALLAGLVAVLVGAAVAILLAARMTGPLRRLHRGTEIIGAGNLDYRIAVCGSDEIGQLAAAFNAMTGQLQKNYQAVERTKKEWEDTFDAISDPLFIHDREFKVLRCNRAYAQAAGMSFQEIIGKPYYEVFPKTGGPMKGCCEALALREEGQEEIADPASGRIFYMKFYLVRDAAGAYLYSLHVLRDISARRKAEEQLLESEQRLSTLIDAIPDAIFFKDGEGRWLVTNPAAQKLFQLGGIAWHGKTEMELAELQPQLQEAHAACKASDDAVWTQAKRVDGIEIIADENGLDRFFEVIKVPLFKPSGTRRGLVIVGRDFTERKRAEEELRALFLAALQSLASAIEAKSPWTRGHSERVAGHAVRIGRALGLAEGELERLRIAGLLHDIGKIGTYDVLLDKPGRLTGVEYETIKQHSSKGAELLAPIKQLQDILPGVRGHHERFDGAGYPDGLKGEEIPLAARILAVADTFDSMTAERPYRTTPGKECAIDDIRRYVGTQFDPIVVEAFLRTEAPADTPFDEKNPVAVAIPGQERS